ncbi:MAG: hypothetical protein HC836_37135 [Richelia sp. RM2_1_2]|nr:hypothetical protein [Richelia sp. RM2_1_2]
MNKFIAAYTYWDERGQRTGDLYKIKTNEIVNEEFCEFITNLIRIEFEENLIDFHYEVCDRVQLKGGLIISSFVADEFYSNRTVKFSKSSGTLVKLTGTISNEIELIGDEIAQFITINKHVPLLDKEPYIDSKVNVLDYITYEIVI